MPFAVPLKVNKIDSVLTQLPFAYYSLPFCKPSEIRDVAENLGEILRGCVLPPQPWFGCLRRPFAGDASPLNFAAIASRTRSTSSR